jgi:mercuric ion binding protein
MKKLFSVAMIAIVSITSVFAQKVKTDHLTVNGNCGMCQKRIEKAAAATAGVTKAAWDVDTKIMAVTYDSTKTSSGAIQKNIAAAGHDAGNEKAADAAYTKLPGCCRYERKDAKSTHDHHHK